MVNKALGGISIALILTAMSVYKHGTQLPQLSNIQVPWQQSSQQQVEQKTNLDTGSFDSHGLYHPVNNDNEPSLKYPYLPDSKLSPGAINEDVGLDVMCQRGFSKTIRHTSGSLKHQIYEEYGIEQHERGLWEIDHIIPLELNGKDSASNLFPQPLHVNWNGYEVGFKVKDEYENFMRGEVCAGRIDLRTAQKSFSQNWIQGRLKYMGSLPKYPYP